MASDDTGQSQEVVQRTLVSPSVVKAELYHRLQDDGINPECEDEERLLYVWRLLQQTERDLQESVVNEEKLRQSQAEEMAEVENYVEHIRSLSDERETLIQELEAENEQLKADMEHVKEDTHAGVIEETTEMLTQQGLDEITNSSITEQIAFLLVERARLLDELEAEQNKSFNFSGAENLDTSFVKGLEQERDELKTDRDKLLEKLSEYSKFETISSENETRIKDLEKDLKKVLEEKADLLQQLSSAKSQTVTATGDSDVIQGLEDERDDLLEQLEKHRKAEEHTRLVHDEEIATLMEENDKAEEELAEFRQKVTSLEGQLEGLRSEVKNLKEERESRAKEGTVTAVQATPVTTRPQSPARSNSDLALRKIILEKTQIESEVVSLRSQLKPLENEKESLENKVRELESELEESHMLKHTLQMKNKTLQSELAEKDRGDETWESKLEEISNEREQMDRQLTAMKVEVTTLQQQHSEELQQLQTDYENVLSQKATLQSEFETKQNELNEQLSEHKVSVENLTSEKEELAFKVKSLNSELETLKTCSTQDILAQTSKLEAVVKERQKLYAQLQDSQREVKEAHNDLRESQNQLEESRGQLDKLRDQVKESQSQLKESQKDLKDMQNQLRQSQNKEKELFTEKESLEESLKSLGSRHSQDSDDLKQKLQMTLAELSRTKTSLEQTTTEKLQTERGRKELEETLEDTKAECESTVTSLQSKIRSLEAEKKSLQDDLCSSQEEQQKTQLQCDQALKTLKSERSSVESNLNEQLKSRINKEESLSREITLLEKSKAELQNSLEKNTSTVVGLQKTLDSVYKERDDLQQRVNTLEECLQQEKGEKLKKLESMQKERDNYKESMDKIQTSLHEDNQEKNNLISELRSERDQLKKELDKVHKSSKYEDEERQEYLERMRSLEEISKQLELDNKELAQQLSEKLAQCQHLDDQMRREKNRQIDKLDKSHEEIERLHVEIDSANDRIRQLREDLQTKQTHINKLEMEAVSTEAKHETAVHKLELEMNDLRLQHRKEIDSFSDKMDSASREMKELLHQMRDKDQELIRFEHEANRAKTLSERLTSQLQTEVKHRAELENKNTVLEQDVAKVWAQVKSLMEKLNNLENSKKSLEDELDRKCHLSKESNEYHTHKLSSQETELSTLRSRAELAEHKVTKLHSELTEAIVKLQATEKQMFENSISRTGFQEKQGEVTELRRSLNETQIQRTLLEQTVQEMKHQMALLKQREAKAQEHNRDLQHMMIDLESKVTEMRDRANTLKETPVEQESADKLQKSESGKRGLADQISKLRREVESLQAELVTAHEKRDIWERRYEDRKVRTKSKLLKAREFYTNERNRLKDQLVKLSDDLMMTRATLKKELEWRAKMEGSHRRLLTEKRDLLTQLTEREETCRDLNRQLSMLGARLKFQEEENARLQETVQSLTNQKHCLDKTVKEFQLDKHKEMLLRTLSPEPHLQSLTAGTSGLGNSMDSSWDPDHLTESRPHSLHHDQPLNGYFIQGLHQGRMEFCGSERSYDFNQEFDA